MPIIHLSQLIGVAAGFEESELKFKRHVVPVDAGRREARSLSLGVWVAVVRGQSRRRHRLGLVRSRLGAAADARA